MKQWILNPHLASFYAGLLVSAYAFGEVLTSMLWGSLSDRIGRKPIVLLGLGGVAVSAVMFGLAKSYWVALLARLLGGMLNGNVSAMQTMLAEMVKRPEHERKSSSCRKHCFQELIREQLRRTRPTLSSGLPEASSAQQWVAILHSRRSRILIAFRLTGSSLSTRTCCLTL